MWTTIFFAFLLYLTRFFASFSRLKQLNFPLNKLNSSYLVQINFNMNILLQRPIVFLDLETTGLNLQEVEFFHGGADGPAADLLDNTYAVIGINDFVTDVEIAITDHEGHPRKQVYKRKRR